MIINADLITLRDRLRADSGPLDEETQQLLGRQVDAWFDPVLTPTLEGVPTQTAREIARVAGAQAIIAAGARGESDRRIYGAARQSFIRTIALLHPIAMPPSWIRLYHYATTVGQDLAGSLGRAPSTEEWDTAIGLGLMSAMAAKLSPAEQKLPPARQDEIVKGRLRRQGITSALRHLDVIRGLSVSVRPTSAVLALRQLLLTPDKNAMAVTSSKSLDLVRHGSPPVHHGLHCTQIFGPVTDGECLCGHYRDASGRICPRCGVIAGAVSLRFERSGVIRLPWTLTNPLTGDPLDAVPVVAAGLRPYESDGQSVTVDELDVLYARLIVLADLASRPNVRGYGADLIKDLAIGALGELAEIARRGRA